MLTFSKFFESFNKLLFTFAKQRTNKDKTKYKQSK